MSGPAEGASQGAGAVIKYLVAGCALFILGIAGAACADEEPEVRYDYVTDTVTAVVSKAAGILTGETQITVSPENRDKPEDYTRDALGRRVPRSTAVKSAQGLHSDLPL